MVFIAATGKQIRTGFFKKFQMVIRASRITEQGNVVRGNDSVAFKPKGPR